MWALTEDKPLFKANYEEHWAELPDNKWESSDIDILYSDGDMPFIATWR